MGLHFDLLKYEAIDVSILLGDPTVFSVLHGQISKELVASDHSDSLIFLQNDHQPIRFLRDQRKCVGLIIFPLGFTLLFLLASNHLHELLSLFLLHQQGPIELLVRFVGLPHEIVAILGILVVSLTSDTRILLLTAFLVHDFFLSAVRSLIVVALQHQGRRDSVVDKKILNEG